MEFIKNHFSFAKKKKKKMDAGDNLIVIICHTSIIVLVSSSRDYSCLSPVMTHRDLPWLTLGELAHTSHRFMSNIIQEMAPLRGINDSFFPCSDFAFIPIIEEIGI